MRSFVLLVALLVPALGSACEYTVNMCQQKLLELVDYRVRAMEYAFGELTALPAKIDVKFVTQRDPDYGRFGGRLAYDREQHRLIVPRRFVSAQMPNPLRIAGHYWPFYQDDLYIREFPVIGAIDNALWSAYMEEAAQRRGVSWPHEGCLSVELNKRLPCEMLMSGIAELITTTRAPLFNENRLDRIWPDDFADFEQHVARNDSEYRDVQRYGGILLVRPLIGEFGVPRALAYIAQTPFRIEGNSVREAALQYQQRARAALEGVNGPVAVSSIAKEPGSLP